MKEEEPYFDSELSERIDKFLRKEIDKKEEKKFIKELRSNKKVKEQYMIQFHLMRGIRFQEIKKLMQEKEKELSIKHKS